MDQANKKQIIVMAALGLVLVVVIIYQLGLFGGSEAPPPPPAPAAAGAPAVVGAPFPGAAAVPAAAAAQGANGPITLAHTDVDVKALLASLKQEPINYKEVRIQRDPMQPLVGKVMDRAKGKGVTDDSSGPETTPADGLTPEPPDAKQQKIVSVQSRRITAIVWDAHAPVAVVDDEIVSVGYTYPDGVQVYAIEPSRVVFKVDESLVTVEMKEK